MVSGDREQIRVVLAPLNLPEWEIKSCPSVEHAEARVEQEKRKLEASTGLVNTSAPEIDDFDPRPPWPVDEPLAAEEPRGVETPDDVPPPSDADAPKPKARAKRQNSVKLANEFVDRFARHADGPTLHRHRAVGTDGA